MRDKFSFSYLVNPPVCKAGFLDVEPVPLGSATARRLALLPTPATPATWIPAFRKSLRFQPVCFIFKAPEVLSYPQRFETLHSSMPNTMNTFRRLRDGSGELRENNEANSVSTKFSDAPVGEKSVRRKQSKRCNQSTIPDDPDSGWGIGYSGIDVGVLGVCGFVFGFDYDFVGVGVFGVEDLFGQADEGLVACYESYVEIGDGALADVETRAGDGLPEDCRGDGLLWVRTTLGPGFLGFVEGFAVEAIDVFKEDAGELAVGADEVIGDAALVEKPVVLQDVDADVDFFF